MNIVRTLFVLLLMLQGILGMAQTDTIPTRDDNMAMGNPSNATAALTDSNNYLLVRSQYGLSYNNRLGIPNWVSWHLSRAWKGDAVRCNCFTQDPLLPAGYFHATTGHYTGSAYDRGHLCPSDDRDGSDTDNAATFHMSNIAPQAGYMNQQTWAYLEDYCRDLVYQGNELYITAGGYGSTGTIAGGSISVPEWFWKVILVLPNDTGDVARVDNNTRVVAVLMPNNDTVNRHSWDYYRVTTDTVELLTGYNLLRNVDTAVQRVIEARTDAGATPLLAWDMTGANNVPTWTATTVNNGLDTGSSRALITRGSTAPGSAGANSFRSTGFKNEGIALSNDDYFQVTVRAKAGRVVSLASVDASLAGTASFCASPGVTQQFAYSLDGSSFTFIGAPFVTTGTPVSINTIDLTGISALQHVNESTTIYIRYYASGQTTTGGWGLNSTDTGINALSIGGTVEELGAIAGASQLCNGSATTLSHSIAGGTWSSSNTGVATVNTTSGAVTASSAGAAVISYHIYGSAVTHTITVTAQPGAITGVTTVQAGATTALSNATAGGAWSAQNTSVATVGAANGIVTGVNAGSAVITYAVGSCIATTTVSVTSASVPPAVLCQGTTITLTDTIAGGTWQSNNMSIATVTNAGVVTGVNAASTTILHRRPGGSIRSYTVTVNVLKPITTTGTLSMCQGQLRTFANATPGAGTWSVSNTAVAVVNASGIVTGAGGGTATISYTTAAGCVATRNIAVSGTASISGSMVVCMGQTTNVSNSIAGGNWSTSSGSLATISATGVAGGVAAGSPRVSYIWPNGCQSVATLTVLPLSATTGGTSGMCQSSMMTLANSTPGGGVWTSSNTSVATVSTTGVVRGAGVGSVIISFTTPHGCVQRRTVTVNGCRETDSTSTTGTMTTASDANIVLSPNPGDGVFTLTGSVSTEDLTAQVVDMQGREVYRATMFAHNGRLRTQFTLPAHLPAGSYTLRLAWAGGSKVIRFLLRGG